tara:strand:+ start:531 stop:1295 length:765 start_codon:yes stop_codon:yes gene_type:complete
MKILVDCDFVVYKCCAGCESEIDFGDDIIVVTSRFSEAYGMVRRELEKIALKFGAFGNLILFFSDSQNFRKDIESSYKGNRQKKKPCGYRRVINKLAEEFDVVRIPKLEADDAIGLYSTQNPGNVIVSPDKDMKQIPGNLYNFEDVTVITPQFARRWHAIQLTSGDATDGYSGIPGIGIKKAIKLFEEKGYTWKTVVDAYAEKGLSEDVALMNARLAKILTKDDYDFQKKEPILWTPTPNYSFDDGARLEVEAD